MSTNYYAFGPFIGGGEGLHIGQTAAGWRFLFRRQSHLGLTTFADWSEFIDRSDVTIRNEYGREVTAEEMRQTMTETSGYQGAPLRRRFHHDSPDQYTDSDGYAFSRRDFCADEIPQEPQP